MLPLSLLITSRESQRQVETGKKVRISEGGNVRDQPPMKGQHLNAVSAECSVPL
jgi:hypothetical protein